MVEQQMNDLQLFIITINNQLQSLLQPFTTI